MLSLKILGVLYAILSVLEEFLDGIALAVGVVPASLEYANTTK